MTVSPTSINVTAGLGDQAPTADISVLITSASAQSVTAYIGGNFTTNGIASSGSTNAGNGGADISLTFKAPSTLGVGTYTDTVTIQACKDQACTGQYDNSPQSVSVTYVVTNALPPSVAPSLSSITPASATAGDSGFTITATGSNFRPQSVLQWNGSPRATTFVSPNQLTASISTADIAVAGNFPVSVADTGLVSNPLTFMVQPPPNLSLTSAFPSVVPTGGSAYVMTALGTAFNTGSVIEWNGAPLTTTFVSTTVLQATVPATDIATSGTAAVQVNNTRGQVGVSNVANVSIANALPDAVSFLVTPSHSGAITFKSASFPASSKWSVDVGGTPSYALIAAGKVFLTVNVGGGTQLIALDQATGATVWGPIFIAGLANAAYDGGSVFVLSAPSAGVNPGLMQSYDAATGKILWSASLNGQYAFDSAPTALNGLVFTGGAGSGGTLYAVNEATGAITWTQSVANGNASTPAVTNDGVYVSYPCQTYDFTPSSGAPVWTNSAGCDGGGGGTPVVGGGTLFSANGFGSYDGATFNAETGAPLGSYAADVPMAVGPQAAYFLKGGTLRALASGSNMVLWSFTGDGTLNTSPILVNGYVIIGASSGAVYGLDATTGAIVWQVNAGAALQAGAGWDAGLQLSGLTAGDGLLVIPAGTTVTAYSLSTNP
jgi:outer membrane protein assembly factor BamB